MEIHLEMPYIVPVDRVFELGESLSGYFNVPVSVIPHYRENKIDSDFIGNHKEDFIRIMAGQSGHFACLLENAEFKLEGANLSVHLSTNSGKILPTWSTPSPPTRPPLNTIRPTPNRSAAWDCSITARAKRLKHARRLNAI